MLALSGAWHAWRMLQGCDRASPTEDDNTTQPANDLTTKRRLGLVYNFHTMSGIEIIGLILGGIPLVISAAEHYKEGFEPFLKWHRFKREFRGFVNSVDLEKRMFDGLLDRLLRYTDLPLEQKEMLLKDPYQGWEWESTGKALKLRLGDSYRSCMYILETMKEDMLKLQTMMSLKDGSVSTETLYEMQALITYLTGRLGEARRGQMELSKETNLTKLQ